MQNNIQNRNFYNEILTEHNMRPEFKYDLPAANVVLEGVNPNCGDDIWLKLKVENGVIEDGSFVGDGCYIPGVGRYNAWNDHRKDQGGGLEAWAALSEDDTGRGAR